MLLHHAALAAGDRQRPDRIHIDVVLALGLKTVMRGPAGNRREPASLDACMRRVILTLENVNRQPDIRADGVDMQIAGPAGLPRATVLAAFGHRRRRGILFLGLRERAPQ